MKKSLDELHDVAKGIAMFLGRGWEASKRELPDHPGCGDVKLVNGPYAVEINTSDYAKFRGKYVLLPVWPRTSGDSVLGAYVTYSPQTDMVDAISVSQSKTEQEIALDFERRLEDRYIKAFDTCQRRMLTEQENRSKQLLVAAELAATLGGKALDCNQDPTDQPVLDRHGVRSFSVSHDGKSVCRMELRSVPTPVIRKILELLVKEVPR